MIRLEVTCDNCGLMTGELVPISRKNDDWRVNLNEVGRIGKELTDSGWLFVVFGHGPAAFCPTCRRVYALAKSAAG